MTPARFAGRDENRTLLLFSPCLAACASLLACTDPSTIRLPEGRGPELEAVYTVGSETSGVWFADIAAVAVDSTGASWILDPQEPRVVSLASDGSLLGDFLNRGAGPGEAVRPAGLALAPNGSLLVWDSPSGRITRLDRKTGRPDMTHQRAVTGGLYPWPGGWVEPWGPIDWGVERGGEGAMIASAFGGTDPEVLAEVTLPWRTDAEGRRVPHGIERVLGMDRFGRVWVAQAHEYVLRAFRLGDTTAVVTLSHPEGPNPIPIGDSVIDSLQAEARALGFPPWRSGDLPASMPIVRRIVADGDLVLVSVSDLESPAGNAVDVFNVDHGFLGRVHLDHPLPWPMPAPALTGEFLAAPWYDSLGRPMVTVYRLRARTGSPDDG